MDDMTHGTSGAGAKRRADDDVGVCVAKRGRFEREGSGEESGEESSEGSGEENESDSDEENDNDSESKSDGDNNSDIELGAVMSTARVSEPQSARSTNQVSTQAHEDGGARLYSTLKRCNYEDKVLGRRKERQVMQKYIDDLEDTVRRTTTEGDLNRQVLKQGEECHRRWESQHKSPYGIWAASRRVLLERIAVLERAGGPSRSTFHPETLEKIAKLESGNAHLRQAVKRWKDSFFSLQDASSAQEQEIITLRARIIALEEEAGELKRINLEADNKDQTFDDTGNQTRQASQNVTVAQDEARINNEKLERQLRDSHLADREDSMRKESQELKERLQNGELAASESVSTVSNTELKQWQKTQEDLQAQIEERDAKIKELESGCPNRDLEKDESAAMDALRAARARTKAMYEHYDTAQTKGAILYSKLRRVAQAIDADTPTTLFRKNLDALEAPKLTQLPEFEAEE